MRRRFTSSGSTGSTGSSGSGFTVRVRVEPARRPMAESPDSRYSSTSATVRAVAGRRGAGRACRARWSRVRRRSRAPARRRSVALSRMRAAGTRGREAADLGHLGEQVQVLDAGQAVGADRDADARGVEAIDRRHAGAGPAVAARTGDDRRAGGRETRQLCVGQVHAVHGEQTVARPARADRDTRRGRRRAASTTGSRRPAPRAARATRRCPRAGTRSPAPTRRDGR